MRRSPIAASVLLAALFGTVFGVAGALAVGARPAEHASRPVELGVVAQPYLSVATTPDNPSSSRSLPLATFATIAALFFAYSFSNATWRKARITRARRWLPVRLRGPPLAL